MSAPFPISLEAVTGRSQAAYTGADSLTATSESIEALLTNAILNQPRSLQRTIGPSEIGTECDHCLAAKLAGWQETQSGIPWASTVGTAIHALLEDFIDNKEAKDASHGGPYPNRYVTEYKVTVGQIGGVNISGSIDCLDLQNGTTIDWKCVSPSSLASYKRKGASPVYRTQAHLYAKGCNDAGIRVERVSICFLPRSSNNFYDRFWWSEPYNPELAAAALSRANQLHANLTAFESISVDARDRYITGLPRASGCYSCARFPDAPTKTPKTTEGILMDLPQGPKKTQTPTPKEQEK